MRCAKCGKDFPAGNVQCPHCQAPVHYGGNTQFYGQAAKNELSISDFFAHVFSAQPAGAGDKMFASGTSQTTPTPDRMLQEWNKPWLYGRVILFGILFELLCYFLFNKQGQPGGMYMFLTFGCLIVPLAVLIFYWEINIPRDIPLYKVLLIFFIGGMLSLIFTLLLPSPFDGTNFYVAPLTEEPGKVLALAIFVYMLDCRYIFGGLLVGAAVGAGFAAFEDIYYVMDKSLMPTLYLLLNYLGNHLQDMAALINYLPYYFKHDFNSIPPEVLSGVIKPFFEATRTAIYELGSNILETRSLHTLGGHVTWAAIEGGALVMVKGNESFNAKHFVDPRFLAYLGSTMAMHAAWNYGFKLHPLPYVDDLVYVLLSIAAVLIAFTLIQRAVKQVLEVANTAQPPMPSGNIRILKAVAGPFVNALFPLDRRVTLGRDPASCNVVLPADTAGVSRRHCVLEPHSDGVYLMDLASTSGTFFQNGQRLPINQWVKVTDKFYLGSQNVMFSVGKTGNVNPQVQQPFTPQQQPFTPQPPPQIQNAVSVTCLAGPLQGSQFSDSQRLVIGREPTQCNVVLPPKTAGVSRRHCILERRADGVYIMDVGSSSGTFFENGQRLPINQWVKVTGKFFLGSRSVAFTVN